MPQPPAAVLRCDFTTVLRAIEQGRSFDDLAAEHGTGVAPMADRADPALLPGPGDRPIMAMLPREGIEALRRQAHARGVTAAQWARHLLLGAVRAAQAAETTEAAR